MSVGYGVVCLEGYRIVLSLITSTHISCALLPGCLDNLRLRVEMLTVVAAARVDVDNMNMGTGEMVDMIVDGGEHKLDAMDTDAIDVVEFQVTELGVFEVAGTASSAALSILLVCSSV